ncbi:alpha/beta fold hydrolase [Haladaptatus salinisoli]|uniref:alpha/beta fold hydrolase n=1 Tax=Haladaptatus salinisoli TaxID=2884876 RepID=UPI001D0B45E5|nr:alpha/beta hydrolase [Haladaptatus salinisoli]
MPYLSANDETRLYYTDLGDGHPVVLIHGDMMSGRLWERQTSLLADRYRLVAPDLRGHGRSDAPMGEYSVSVFAEDLRALIETLDLEDVTLVGWSYGALVAGTYLRKSDDRIRDVVLVSSVLFHRLASPDEDVFVNFSDLVEDLKARRPELVWELLDELFGDRAGGRTKRWVWHVCMESALHANVGVFEDFATIDWSGLRETFAEFDRPAAVFHGAQDDSATPEDVETVARDILRDGSSAVFAESGHFPFLVETERFNREITAFVG